jgi:hypothetical protein
MACSSITGAVTKSCANNVGGIVKLYIANADDVLTITDTGGDGDIDILAMDTGKYFYEFQFDPETSNFTENMVKNLESGATFFDQTISVFIKRKESAKRAQMILLTQGEFKAIVKDSNGLYWMVGEANNMYLSKNDSGTGTKKEDKNGYTLEFKSIGEYDPAKELDVTNNPTIVSANVA